MSTLAELLAEDTGGTMLTRALGSGSLVHAFGRNRATLDVIAGSGSLMRALRDDSTAFQALMRPEVERVARWTPRAVEVARIRRRALALARGNDALALESARLLAELLGRGRTSTATLAVAALDGDADALAEWRRIAQDGGSPSRDLARRVLDLAERVRVLADDVSALVADYAAVVLPDLLDDLDTHREPPPAVSVRGSVECNAPPVMPPCAHATSGRRDATRTPGGSPP